MKQDKRLIAIGVMAVLAIALILVIRLVDFGKKEEETADETEQIEPLFPDELGNVTAIEVINNETGQTFQASRGEGESWEIVEAAEGTDTGLGIDEFRLATPLFGLPGLTPNRVLNDVERLSDFGLEDVLYTVKFETSTGMSHTLYVGAKNPGGMAYYVQIPNDPQVYLISSYNLEDLLTFPENPPYIQPTPDPDATPEATVDETVSG